VTLLRTVLLKSQFLQLKMAVGPLLCLPKHTNFFMYLLINTLVRLPTPAKKVMGKA